MARGGDDYDDMLKALYGKPGGNKDQYQELMAKEKNVLNTVNRIANQKRRDLNQKEQFIHLPLLAIIMRFSDVMVALFHDLVKAKSIRKIGRAFRREDRMIYVGVLLVVVALVLLLVQTS